MCHGISLARCEIPESLIERYDLEHRRIRRCETGEDEYRFLLSEKSPRLPVWFEGQFQILPWGNQDRRHRVPVSGWCPQEALDAGLWSHLRPLEVFVPATFGWEHGVWYQIREGVKGILVRDAQKQHRVYLLTRKSTHYYEIMTRSNREPVMVGETI